VTSMRSTPRRTGLSWSRSEREYSLNPDGFVNFLSSFLCVKCTIVRLRRGGFRSSWQSHAHDDGTILSLPCEAPMLMSRRRPFTLDPSEITILSNLDRGVIRKGYGTPNKRLCRKLQTRLRRREGAVTWQSPISPQMFLQTGLGRASTRQLGQSPVGGDWVLPR